ncbi:MAG: hypothetical protein ACD_26C00015G0001 [uncultured bacterium]|nr:MAG: hypothetical protein ACD_26C00015G0001 [uncultured bacterium]
MNILVTGGAGYIGAHFVNAFLEKNDVNIIVVDNFREGKNNIIKNKKVRYNNVDLLDYCALHSIFKKNKIDIVVHFAALASVPDSVVDPQGYYENNIIGGFNLLKCMNEFNVKKIIFSSSASVYGEPVKELIDENHPKVPTNPYGYTKLVFEQMLVDYNKAYGLNSISFRYFCASGASESLLLGEYHTPETHVIPSLLETALGKRERFFVFGDDYNTLDGTGVRDYIHVDDIASAHVVAIKRLFKNDNVCEVFNLGINKGFSVLQLIEATEKVTNKKINYTIKERRKGDPSSLVADAKRATEVLDWKPKYLDIEKIIETAYNSYKKKI